MTQVTNPHFLALDVGDKRVGVATADVSTRIASPLVTLANDTSLFANIKKLVDDNQVDTIVVGLPRNLDGQDSAQTAKVRSFVEKLSLELDVKTVTQDEALSSVRAEEELGLHGKIFAKAEVDKLAACLILEDYIKELKND